MDNSSRAAVWDLASEQPDYVEVLRMCHELAVEQGLFTAHDVNAHLAALGIGNGRFNLRPLLRRGLIQVVDDPANKRRTSYEMPDIEGVGAALVGLDPESK
jgi:hypothetical protein